MLTLNTNRVAEALYNLTPNSGADESYCKGMIIGMIATMVAMGINPVNAAHLIRAHLPANYRESCLPDAFKREIEENPQG